jgi:predicted metal-binding membrane protein
MTAGAVTEPLLRVAVRYPGWWVLIASAAAWTLLVVNGSMPQSFPLCLPPSLGRAGQVAAGLEAAWQTRVATGAMMGWVLMAVAMTPPLAMGLIRHVSVRSFAPRRYRAVLEFVLGGLAPWILFGAVAVPVLLWLPMSGHTQSVAAAVAFAAAAAWQLTPAKRLVLRRCHRTQPLAPAGWQADRDCLRYGLIHGGYCVASCWAMMLACMVTAHPWLAMLYVQIIAHNERQAREPPATASALALLGGSALSALSVW